MVNYMVSVLVFGFGFLSSNFFFSQKNKPYNMAENEKKKKQQKI